MSLARIIHVAGRVPLVGRALRRLARRFPEGSVVTIRSGHASGYKWRRYHRYVNGYWLGQYELPLQEALVRELKPGGVFYDVGANAGFFTLVAAKCVGPRGACYAFEPLPENAEAVRNQLEVNALDNCHLISEAVSDHAGSECFSLADDDSYSTAHLGNAQAGDRSVEVKVNTLDHYYDLHGAPDLIKMDIEGAEVLALQGAARLLRDARPTLIIEVHTPACEDGVMRILSELGYDCRELDGTPYRRCDRLPHHVLCKAGGKPN